jgi:hypothetical protein
MTREAAQAASVAMAAELGAGWLPSTMRCVNDIYYPQAKCGEVQVLQNGLGVYRAWLDITASKGTAPQAAAALTERLAVTMRALARAGGQ